MTWLVVVNPHAGVAAPSAAAVEELLTARNVDCRLVVTDGVAALRRQVDSAVEVGVRKFAVVGGDGSMHALLNSVLRHSWPTRPTLAIVPAGTGADLTRTFAMTRSLDAAIGVLAEGEAYTMDVGRIEFADGQRCWFANVVDLGIAAAAVKTARRIPRRIGGIRYTSAFWLTLPAFRPAPITVRTSKREISEVALNIVVANGQFFGGGLNIAPQAAISDGLLDAEVFVGPRMRAFSVMPRVIRGLHLRHPAVKTMRSARFEIEVPERWPVEADGELVGHGSVIVDAVPGAIDLMI